MKDYRKYKWFYTSSGKLVVGGKNAKQNDELLNIIIKGKNKIIMHTSQPGSPFSVIISEEKNVTKKDLEECAIFTGCFSRAWKQNKKKTLVHVFSSKNLEKDKKMKEGTWGVKSKIKEYKIELKLALVVQKRTLRGVPAKSVSGDEILLLVFPGRVNKEGKAIDIMKILKDKNVEVKKEDILGALPAGGVRW